MRLSDLLGTAVRNVLRGGIKVRLCVLALCIGICSVCCVLSLGSLAEGVVADQIEQMGLGGIVFYTTDKSFKVDTASVDAVSAIEGVRAVMPLTFKTGYAWLRGQGGQAIVCAADSALDQVFTLRLLHGRLLSRQDIGGGSRVAVIDDELAQSVYRRTNIVGKTITLSVGGVSDTFTVVGVIQSQKQGLEQLVGAAIPNLIYIPFTAMDTMTGGSASDFLAVSCFAQADSAAVAQRVASRLERLHSLVFQHENLTQISDGMKQITAIVSLLVAAVAGISILVGGFGVMNIMIAAVEARTREIGIYIALGAGRGSIVGTFLLEAQFIALTGGVLGVILCRVCLWLAGVMSGYSFAISPGALVISLVCATACGMLFGLVPAYRASGLDPIEAIRLER